MSNPLSILSLTLFIQARKRIQSDALAPFSASPSIMKPLRNMSSPDGLELLGCPSAPLPTKRISSDSIDRPQASASKRFKPSLPPAIDRSPKKFTSAKPSIRHWSPDLGETSSEVDPLNLGVGRTKFPADPFKFARKPLPSTSRPPPPPISSPQKTSNDFSDLNSVRHLAISRSPSLTFTRNLWTTSDLYSPLTRIFAGWSAT